jgi:hypothetical protein
MNPTHAKSKTNPFFNMPIPLIRLSPLVSFKYSIKTGNRRANELLQTAPMSEINSPKLGTMSATPNVTKSLGGNNREIKFCLNKSKRKYFSGFESRVFHFHLHTSLVSRIRQIYRFNIPSTITNLKSISPMKGFSSANLIFLLIDGNMISIGM